MKALIRRHIMPLCLLLCSTVLLGAFLFVRLRADAGNYALVQKFGDVAQLNDLRIQLVLGDGRHEQYITLDGSTLTHRFSAVPPYADTSASTYYASQDWTEDPNADVRTKVNTVTDESAQDHSTLRDVMTRQADRARLSMELSKSITGSAQAVHVLTDLYVQDDAHPFISTFERFRYRYPGDAGGDIREDVGPYEELSFEMPDARLQNGSGRAYDLIATDTRGRVYFTPAVLPAMRGECAVYRVQEWSKYGYSVEPARRDGYEYNLPYAATERGKISKLASFPAADTTTLRLDIVEDRICLLSIEGGMLTLRAFTMDGTLIAQTPLFSIDPNIPYSTGLSSNADGDSSMLCYALYTLGETGMYSKLCFLSCVELTSSSAVLRSHIKPQSDLIDHAFFGGRWALLRIENAGSDGRQDSLYTPLRYTLELLDANGNSLYAGEIVTNAPEDYLQYYGRTVENSTNEALRFAPVRTLRFAQDPIAGR